MYQEMFGNSSLDKAINSYAISKSLNQFFTKVGVNIDAKMPLSSKANFLTAIKSIKTILF